MRNVSFARVSILLSIVLLVSFPLLAANPVAPSVGASAAAAGAPSVAQTGAESVDHAWMKAMKAGDLEAVMACYAPDAALWMPGAPETSGEKAIRAAFQGLFAQNKVQDVAITDAHYKTSGNVSTGWG